MDITNYINPVLSLGGLGLLFGILLGYASKKFAIEVDPKIPAVRDALPGANCGGCGYPGCDACAKAMVEGEASPDACPVGGAEVAKNIGEILGISVEAGEKTVAFVKCKGTCDKSKEKFKYNGIMDCRQAAHTPGEGSKSCSYGCLGLGSCVEACAFDAIGIVDGIAVVDEDKCTACGMCVKACPKNLIDLVPASKKVRVQCNSEDKGKDVRSYCEVGCIGCNICQRTCKFDAIKVTNNIAQVDYSKCTQCMECVNKCPTKVISGLVEKVQ